MSDNFISALRQIFEFSGVAAIITDENLKVIWRNKLSKPIPGESRNDMSFVFGGDPPETGLKHVSSGGLVYSFNVLKAEKPSDKKIFYIFELVHTEKLDNILSCPAVRDFISFICMRIRESLGNITLFTDDIFNEISIGCPDYKEITDRLNGIDRNIMMLAKEIVAPEQFYVLLDSDGGDMTLSLEDEISKCAESVKNILGKKIRVAEDYDKNICFRMEKSSFETVIAGMTAECCETELMPERLLFSTRRSGDGRAEISVMSINTDGGKNTKYDAETGGRAKKMKLNRHMFFEYVCSLMQKKYGAIFTRTEMPNGLMYKMELDVIPAGVPSIALTKAGYSIKSERFSTMALSLAYFRPDDRYYFVPVERIDDALEKENEQRKEIKNEQNQF